MRLVADCGNRNIKWRLNQRRGSFASTPHGIRKRLESHWGHIESVDALGAVSVAGPEIEQTISDFAAERWSVEARFVRPTERACGVVNGYIRPVQLGADRWAAVIAAWHRCGGRALVVADCGTAITVDAVNNQGEYIGGSIIPGFAMARIALSRNTREIGEAAGDDALLPGRSTPQAVGGGTAIATAAGTDELVSRYLGLAGTDAQLFLTGGDAEMLARFTRHRFDTAADLVLDGVALLCDEHARR